MEKREKLLAIARICFDAGVAAADPLAAVEKRLAVRPDVLSHEGRLFVVAIGKAAAPMMRAVLGHCSPNAAILVTNYENEVDIAGVECLGAGHPTPDANGAAAADVVIRLLENTVEGDKVVLLLSGGGSALTPAPIDGLSLDEKIALNDLTLKSGAPIDAMNTVRKRLSRLKGGGFANLAAPAVVTSLILSDVPGDDIAVVASGPTVGNTDAPEAAEGILRQYGLWDQAPAPVRDLLRADVVEQTAEVENILIGGNAPSVDAMVAAAPADYAMRRYDGWMDGDVAEAAVQIATDMRGATEPTLFLYGGETTVVVTGNGRGGRNQELALRIALLMEAEPPRGEWLFLSGGTDGRDGPTDAAGGVVDAATLSAMRSAGVDPEAELANNNAYDALAAAKALLMTGATGTNVADLQVGVVCP
ncbi:MAG: glycerate kinase type-2 family protein [Pikeienuella sp.]